VHVLWENVLSGMLDFDFMVQNKTTSHKVGVIVLNLANGKTEMLTTSLFCLRKMYFRYTRTQTHTQTQRDRKSPPAVTKLT
jgi:hypothetical protein